MARSRRPDRASWVVDGASSHRRSGDRRTRDRGNRHGMPGKPNAVGADVVQPADPGVRTQWRRLGGRPCGHRGVTRSLVVATPAPVSGAAPQSSKRVTLSSNRLGRQIVQSFWPPNRPIVWAAKSSWPGSTLPDAHIFSAPLVARRISRFRFSRSGIGERAMQQHLGQFGDRRRQKGGPIFWPV